MTQEDHDEIPPSLDTTEECPACPRQAALSALFASLGQGLAWVDPEGRIREVNPSFCALMGVRREDVLGQPFEALGLDPSQQDIGAIFGLFRRGLAHAPVSVTIAVASQDISLRIQPLARGEHFLGVVLTADDVTPLMEIKRTLEREKRQLEALLATAGSAISILDAETAIQTVNEEFTRLTGFSAAEAVGHMSRELLSCVCDDHASPDDKAGREGVVYRRQCVIQTKGGESRHVIRNVSLLSDEQEGLIGGVEALTDITELMHSRTKAEEASRHKSRFLASMSHEIRTPLTAMLGMNQLLSRTGLTAKQRELVDVIALAGQNLLNLVNDILDLSKIEEGRIRLSPGPVSLAALADETVRLLGPQAEDKGLKLSLTLDADLPPFVLVDALRLRQILVNLIGNAIKFTSEGEVGLDVGLLDEAEDSGLARVRFTVSDSGRGIDALAKKRVFQAFEQAREEDSRVHGGTGLGLAISANLVQLLGGSSIAVDSEPGKGSRFSFELALRPAEPDAQARAAHEPCAPRNHFAPLRVLAAEDSPFNRELLHRVLETIGVGQAVLVDHGQAALAAWDEARQAGHPFHAVLLDMRMPVLDGPACAKALRERGARQPIIALTANAMEADREECLQAGMDGFLSKPYLIEDIEEVLGKVADEVWRDEHRDEPEAQPRDEPDDPLATIRNYFRTVMGLPDEIVPELLDLAASSLSENLGAYEKALALLNYEDCTLSAHAIKGSLSNLGLTELAEIAQEMERDSRECRVERMAMLAERLRGKLDFLLKKES